MNPAESLELEKGEQQAGTALESKPEAKDQAAIGAEMLEEPADGSFQHGLQLFIAWVNSLLANDDNDDDSTKP